MFTVIICQGFSQLHMDYTTLKKVAYFVFVTLICLGVLELGIRLVRPQWGLINPSSVASRSIQYTENRATGYRAWPNQDVHVLDFGVDYRINNFGFRGQDVSIAPSETRLIVVGGSQVFDIYATEGADWPHQIAVPNLEVINAGLPGYNSFNSLALIQSHLWQFAPDYILIDHCWNDLKYMNVLSPEFTYTEMRLREPSLYVDPSLAAQYSRSHYYNAFDELLSNSLLYLRMRELSLDMWQGAPLTMEGTVASAGETETRPVTETGIQQYRLNLTMMLELSRQIGAEPIFLLQPRLVAENQSAANTKIDFHVVEMDFEMLLNAFNTCDSVMQDLASENNVQVIDASEMNGNDDYFRDHVHTTIAGSERLAQIISVTMADMSNTSD
jgi:hypothetical protein